MTYRFDMPSSFDYLLQRELYIGICLVLHVYKLTFAIVELILKHSEFLRWNNADTKTVFHLPLTLDGDKSLSDISFNVWMNIERELVDTYLVNEVGNLILKNLGKEHT